MRELARLLATLQAEETATGRTLNSYINVSSFDKVLEAVEVEGKPMTAEAFERHMLNDTQPYFSEYQLAKDKFPCLCISRLVIHIQRKVTT